MVRAFLNHVLVPWRLPGQGDGRSKMRAIITAALAGLFLFAAPVKATDTHNWRKAQRNHRLQDNCRWHMAA